MNFTDIKTTRSLLRDNTESLGKVSKDLFGKDFKAHLKAETKVSKDAEDYFSQHSLKKTTLKPQSKPLFRSGPFPNQRGKGQSPFKKSSQRREKTDQQRFSGEYTKKPLFQHVNTTDWLPTLKHVHPLIKHMFQTNVPDMPFAGRIKHFLPNWQKLSSDQVILNIVKGWEIPLLEEPVQLKEPHQIQMNNLESEATDLEVDSMLKKGAIRIAIPKQILSNIFVRPKKGENFDQL